jgi:hypothetical protein
MNPRYSRYYTFIKPIVNNKSIRNYTFLVFSVITSVVFIIFAIQPTVKTIIALQKSIEEQQKILEQAKKKVEQLTIGKQNYDRLSPTVKANLATMVPSNPDLPSLISDLSSLARVEQASLSGIQFQTVNLPQKTSKKALTGEVQTIEFTINAQGQYKNLVDFLNTLNNFNHLISITSANFIKPQDGNLLLTINAKAYYIKNSN